MDFLDGFLCWVVVAFLLCTASNYCSGGNSQVSLKLLETPPPFANSSTATFSFGASCSDDCSFLCELDHRLLSHCQDRKETYFGLGNKQHFFKVCTNEVVCASYNWTVDTIPPTAFVTASAPFTNAANISVRISFSEPCTGRGSFACSSVDSCNLRVYGAAKVVPSSLKTLEQNLKYTLLVSMAPNVQSEQVMLAMDEGFCTDSAGNRFTRTENSTFNVDFDRRNVFVSLKINIPEQVLQLDGKTRMVQATNNNSNLKFDLYFSQPLLNSSSEILKILNTNEGVILPSNGDNFMDRTFHFRVANVSSNNATITITLNNSNSLISRQGNAGSPFPPIAFLYDTRRPTVWLSTASTSRTRNHNVPVSIKFTKPVFGFSSSDILVSGGHLQSFYEVNRSLYSVEIRADIDNGNISVTVPENVTADISGNKNLPSNVVRVKHYSVPMISRVVSTFATVAFLVTFVAAAVLTVSITSLHSALGYFSTPPLILVTSDPSMNLFRMACHIQAFALSQWVAPVMLPIEYYEVARSLRWTIPYFSVLPWEVAAPTSSSGIIKGSMLLLSPKAVMMTSSDNQTYSSPLSPMEYRSLMQTDNTRSDSEYIFDRYNTGWRDFSINVFWLAVIGGGLILLHVLLLLILKFKRRNSSSYGALTLPRLEIFLLVVALPCLCQASTAVIRGGTSSGVIVGLVLLGFVSMSLLALIVFLSMGIVHLQQGRRPPEDKKRSSSQWTWKSRPDSIYLTMFGPLIEDLRGPSPTTTTPSPRGDAVFVGVLRTYYTVLDLVKRACLGIFSGAGLSLRRWNGGGGGGIITLLCITSFQLSFLVLTKPFIETKVQLVEMVSVLGEVGVFASCVVLLLLCKEEVEYNDSTSSIGIFMVGLFLVVFTAQIANEWHALYTRAKMLDPDNNNSFFSGLKVGLYGIITLFVPQKMIPNHENRSIRTTEGQ